MVNSRLEKMNRNVFIVVNLCVGMVVVVRFMSVIRMI